MINKQPREQFELVIAYGDLHLSKANQKQLKVLLEILEYFQPDKIIDLGDLISADPLSDFLKSHKEMIGLEAELKQAHAWLESVNEVSPSSEKIMLHCNHFYDRVMRKIKSESIWLTDVEVMRPENLLQLKKYGWKYVNNYVWKKVLAFAHDFNVKGSTDNIIGAVNKLSLNANMSVVRGHSHTTGFSLKKQHDKLLAAIQLGSAEDPEKAGYIRHKMVCNWTFSVGLFYLSKTKKTWYFVPAYFLDDNSVMIEGVLFTV